jgi:arsenate reductase (thioredoxin)
MSKKRRVLILCTGNSARSQMAEGWLRAQAGDRFDVYSAGSRPTGSVHPGAIQAMAEIGIDIGQHTSKSMAQFMGQPFDCVITVCDSAAEACPIFPGPGKRLHRDFTDPAKAPAHQQMSVFRRVRDELADWLGEQLGVDPITLGPAAPGELPAILALLAENHLPPDGLADHLATTLVARSGTMLVGSAALELYGSAALLRSVSVSPALQRKGLGQRLTIAALALARERGVSRVFLLTETASEFFPRFGFRTVERADVPPAVKQSVEFTTACPDSALVMAVALPVPAETA